MKKIHVVILLIYSFLPAAHAQNKWDKWVLNEHLDVPAIAADDWSYPWYVVEYEEGKFENTLGDSITAQDTIHQIHNSKCFTYVLKNDKMEPEPRSRLPICEALWRNDTLLIGIFDFSASNSEAVEIAVKGDRFLMAYQVNYVVPYKKIEFETLSRRLVLNQSAFEKGRILKGEIHLEIKETIFSESGKKSSSNKLIEGTFEVKIE